MGPKVPTAQPLTGASAIPLKGPQGVIGFIPMSAIDPNTHLIAFEVVLTFVDTGPISVQLHIGQNELQDHVRMADSVRAVPNMRQWLAERAYQQLATVQPEIRTTSVVNSAIYWAHFVNGRPAGHEPFLR